MRLKLVTAFFGIACACAAGAPIMSTAESGNHVEKLWNSHFLEETSAIVSIPTYRDDKTDEHAVVKNLGQVKAKIFAWADEFNRELIYDELEPFEWKRTIDHKEYWLFGLRLGEGDHRIAMITHLDTVPPGGDDWRPFQPRLEQLEYMGENGVDFLVGRGTIDNKGPALHRISWPGCAAR